MLLLAQLLLTILLPKAEKSNIFKEKT